MSFNLGDGEDNFTRRRSLLAEINMTPFVDVCLVLLIIFMVTAPFAVSGVNVNLPKTQAKSLTLSNQSVILSINKKGQFYLDKSLVEEKELVTRIRAATSQEEHPALFIRADSGVPYGRVMIAMSAAQRAGVEKIGMMGENKKER